ncbi:MAG: hypothetical protein KC413_01760 [Anaerolineales bacterium]|nr:hypothetical protein [Anaerolineales bacterium]MCA9974438.1 hypothetical protein [Anaerolineales bacterium]
MIIQKMRNYFLYNVPVTEQLMSASNNRSMGVTPAFIEKFSQKFQVNRAKIPAFYTNHYRAEHTPYSITDPTLPMQTTLDYQRLLAIDFYADLPLTKDITVRWEFVLTLQNTGMVTVWLEVEEPMPSQLAYRLSGLHLNPTYTVISTEPVSQLWHDAPETRPAFVTLDEFARVLHQYFFQGCGLNVRRYRALQHEIQIPFTAVEVATDLPSQRQFIEQNMRELAELVFKPACWEVEQASYQHALDVFEPSRVWSIARDTFVVVAYEGAIYVKIKTFDTGVPHQVSGFALADELSVLHSFKVAVSNYHFLRILDDLIDQEEERLNRAVTRFQYVLRELFLPGSDGSENILQEMNDFAIQITNLQFHLTDLLAEIYNSDKLIDEEWHIVLLDKLNKALGTTVWYESVQDRINNLRDIAQTVENSYERLLNLRFSKSIADVNLHLLEMTIEDQNVENRLKRVQPVFEALAAAELIGLLIAIVFDDTNALVSKTSQWLNMPLALSHLINGLGVLLILFLVIRSIRWWVNR